MSKKSTRTFFHEMPLRVNRMQLHAVIKCFDVAHFPYNAAVQDVLGRLDPMRADPRFSVACKIPKKEAAHRASRNAVLAALRAQ